MSVVWKRKDHTRGRMCIAALASLPAALSLSILFAAVVPLSQSWAFAWAYLGVFLAWPAMFWLLISRATTTKAAAWAAALTVLPALVVVAGS